jgi:hypothetical protein
MKSTNQVDKNSFLYPCHRYHGEFKPENLLFNANLQEFAQRVSYIYNLQNTGKLNSQEAYNRIESLWKQLEQSKQQLRIGEHPFDSQEGNE